MIWYKNCGFIYLSSFPFVSGVYFSFFLFLFPLSLFLFPCFRLCNGVVVTDRVPSTGPYQLLVNMNIQWTPFAHL